MNAPTEQWPFNQTSMSVALSQPRIVRLSENLYAAALEVMKVIPAKHILERALVDGVIDRHTVIIESSSGNFALGLAVVCRELGLKLHIVGDPAIDTGLRRMLVNLGAEVDLIKHPDQFGSYQRLRLDRVQELLRQHSNAYWVRQYDNPDNPAAYRSLASSLTEALGGDFDLVASVGSGGSSVGLATALRYCHPAMRLTGVDTFHSVLFGLPDGKRTLRGLGNSVMPKILDHTQFNQVHWLSSPVANSAASELHARHALFCGPTSGAAYWVARYQADRHPNRRTLFICPDTGYRYLTTVHDDAWLRKNGELAETMPTEPLLAASLEQVGTHSEWSCLDWSRRSLATVMCQRSAELVE